MTKTTKLTEADLRQFIGTENWYRHWLKPNVVYTDGVKYVADHAGAYWLVDEIAIGQFDLRIAAEPIQFWKLLVCDDRSAELRCEDGNDRCVFSKRIGYTDFPLPEIALYFTDDTLLLASEY